ncbi:MAG: hypothetical protein M1269_03580 [Chloroflexi bacterium]|nr:hypothetical protein [Chloroflexota bacterium]
MLKICIMNDKMEIDSCPPSARTKPEKWKKIFFPLITLGIYILIFIVLILIWAAYKSNELYNHIKHEKIAERSKTYLKDPGLYFSSVLLSLDESCDDYYVKANRAGSSGPLVLALGDSFTVGVGCKLSETYPYKVAERLNGGFINAGACGAGLSQMLIFGRRLIPKYRPRYVLAQYSPWLTTRAGELFSPSKMMDPSGQAGYILIPPSPPTPFLTESPDGSISLHPAVYRSKFLDIPEKYRKTPPGLIDRISFILSAGVPAYADDLFEKTLYKIKGKLGLTPMPSQNQEKIIKYVFNELNDICKKNGSTLVIVAMDGFQNYILAELSYSKTRALKSIDGAIFVDAMTPLFEKLDTKTYDAYSRKYHFWKGTPPACVDKHPNPEAQKMTAEEILKAIKNAK